MARISPDAHWRDSARYPRFFIIDARAAFPVLLALVHIRLWTMGLALAAMLFFAVLHYYGFTVPVFGRWLSGLLAGRKKDASPWWLR
jgi:intracellular multiplication protein IcmT